LLIVKYVIFLPRPPPPKKNPVCANRYRQLFRRRKYFPNEILLPQTCMWWRVTPRVTVWWVTMCLLYVNTIGISISNQLLQKVVQVVRKKNTPAFTNTHTREITHAHARTNAALTDPTDVLYTYMWENECRTRYYYFSSRHRWIPFWSNFQTRARITSKFNETANVLYPASSTKCFQRVPVTFLSFLRSIRLGRYIRLSGTRSCSTRW
jgi:hypothetical protein